MPYVFLRTAHGTAAIAAFGRRQSAPFTLTEALGAMQLVGEENWIVDVLRRHQIRDGLYCAFRRSVLTFWSPKLLNGLEPAARALPHRERFERLGKHLTGREIEVLRIVYQESARTVIIWWTDVE
jgi:hypothetical protein